MNAKMLARQFQLSRHHITCPWGPGCCRPRNEPARPLARRIQRRREARRWQREERT